MTPPTLRRAVAALAALPLLSMPTVALAAPTGLAPHSRLAPAVKIPPLIAFGDAQSILPDVALSTALSGLPACGHGKVPAEPSFAKALAAANGLFKGKAASGKKKLDAAKYSGTSNRAEVFAAGAAGGRAPEAGLAALLDAERHASHDPMLFIDASVFLTELGRPADALAFIDHAHKMGRIKGAPLGLSGVAVQDNDRGFALLGLHRYAAALTALDAATRAGGRLLSEASINKAQALKCMGRQQDSFHALLAGAYRQQYDLVEDDNTSGPSTQEQPPAIQLGFTKPDGPEDVLPPLKYPQHAADADAAHTDFGKLGTFLISEIASIQRQEDSNYLMLIRQLQHVSPLTRQRTNEILQLMTEAYGDPAAKKAGDAAAKAQVNLANFESQFSGQNPPSRCGPHTQWLSLIKTWDTKIRQANAADSKYLAPLVANLGFKLAHQVALESIRVGEDLTLDLLVNDVVNWTAGETSCPNQTTMPPPADKGGEAGDPGECPPILAPDNKLVLKIPGLIDIKVNCESVEGVVEGEGLIAPFVSGERNVHGETTIYGGAKVGVDLGPFSGGELQEGFYVKSGPSGIEDWGVRVSPSATGGAGPVAIEYGSSVDISLAGSIDYIPTAFGFR